MSGRIYSQALYYGVYALFPYFATLNEMAPVSYVHGAALRCVLSIKLRWDPFKSLFPSSCLCRWLRETRAPGWHNRMQLRPIELSRLQQTSFCCRSNRITYRHAVHSEILPTLMVSKKKFPEALACKLCGSQTFDALASKCKPPCVPNSGRVSGKKKIPKTTHKKSKQRT